MARGKNTRRTSLSGTAAHGARRTSPLAATRTKIVAQPQGAGASPSTGKRRRPRTPSPWNQRAFDAILEPAYFDALRDIYPMIDNKRRVIPLVVWNPIRDAYLGDDDAALLRALLHKDVPVFPVDGNAFIETARELPGVIDHNPESLAEVIAQVRQLSLKEIGLRIGAPIRSSRQRGPQFQAWIATRYASTTDVASFLAHEGRTPLLLAFADQKLKRFAVEHLGYSGARGLDAIIKAGGRYIVVEAKLMTSRGGHQDKQVISALALADERGLIETAIPVAVIDGVYLLPHSGGAQYQKMLRESRIPVLHAHGLDAFVHHIGAGGHPHRLPGA